MSADTPRIAPQNFRFGEVTMKPRTITLELTENEIRYLIEKWAQYQYPDDVVANVTLHASPELYDEDHTSVVEWAMEASVRLTAREK